MEKETESISLMTWVRNLIATRFLFTSWDTSIQDVRKCVANAFGFPISMVKHEITEATESGTPIASTLTFSFDETILEFILTWSPSCRNPKLTVISRIS